MSPPEKATRPGRGAGADSTHNQTAEGYTARPTNELRFCDCGSLLMLGWGECYHGRHPMPLKELGVAA
jgi:hypothetical protein